MLRFEGFEVVFPGDVGSDPGGARGVGGEPDEVAPSPAAAVRSEAVEPTNDSTPVGNFAVGCPSEMVAIQKTRRLDIGEGNGEFGGGGREVQLGERSEGVEVIVTDGVQIGSEEVASEIGSEGLDEDGGEGFSFWSCKSSPGVVEVGIGVSFEAMKQVGNSEVG